MLVSMCHIQTEHYFHMKWSSLAVYKLCMFAHSTQCLSMCCSISIVNYIFSCQLRRGIYTFHLFEKQLMHVIGPDSAQKSTRSPIFAVQQVYSVYMYKLWLIFQDSPNLSSHTQILYSLDWFKGNLHETQYLMVKNMVSSRFSLV